MNEPYVMREPCKACGETRGEIQTRSGQDCVYCVGCRRWCYNAPRVETGRAVRSVSTVHSDLKPKERAAVLLRAGGRCELCGKPAAGCATGLHVGHLLSVKDGLARGLTEADLNSPENLAAMCDECNLGLSDTTVPLRLAVAIVLTRLRHQGKAS